MLEKIVYFLKRVFLVYKELNGIIHKRGISIEVGVYISTKASTISLKNGMLIHNIVRSCKSDRAFIEK
jgi:hypothetical protein